LSSSDDELSDEDDEEAEDEIGESSVDHTPYFVRFFLKGFLLD
jgi:hypothetical protein